MQPTEPNRRRWSKLAVTSFVLGLLGLVLSVFAAIPAFLFGVLALVRIKRSRDRLRGRGLAIAGVGFSILFSALFICLLKLASLWKLDAPPIANDYTIADLRSAPRDCDASYDLLVKLSEGKEYRPDASAIGLTEDDVEAIVRIAQDVREEGESLDAIRRIVLENAEAIDQAWKHSEKGRTVVAELNKFTEIADLSEATWVPESIYWKNFQSLMRLYCLHAQLETQRGHGDVAAMQLIEWDAVIRKLMPNARTTLLVMCCYGSLDLVLETATFLVNSAQVSEETINLLQQHFVPLTDGQTSVRNACIFEYLAFRKIVYETYGELISRKSPVFKLNSTLRVYRNMCQGYIDHESAPREELEPYSLSIWPDAYPDWMPDIAIGGDAESVESQLYKYYNPLGYLLLAFSRSLRALPWGRDSFRIKEDLFQILLAKRLGGEASLKARAYSDEYAIDVDKKIIYSPGPDGQAFTRDDIKLPINSEVLKFN